MIPLAVALAAASAAPAAAPGLQIGPVNVGHGYRLTATSIGARSGSALDLYLTRREHHATSRHHYRAVQDVGLRLGSDSRSGTLHAEFGKRARVKLRFHPHGRARKVPPPKGCEGGGGRLQPGRVTGTLRLPTRTFLRTITLH